MNVRSFQLEMNCAPSLFFSFFNFFFNTRGGKCFHSQTGWKQNPFFAILLYFVRTNQGALKLGRCSGSIAADSKLTWSHSQHFCSFSNHFSQSGSSKWTLVAGNSPLSVVWPRRERIRAEVCMSGGLQRWCAAVPSTLMKNQRFKTLPTFVFLF